MNASYIDVSAMHQCTCSSLSVAVPPVANVCVCVYVCVCACVGVFVHACMYECMHVCMHLYV